MHAALWKLLWFDLRGSLRGLSHVRRSWRKLGLLLLMLGFIGFFVLARRYGGDELPQTRFGSAMPFWALIYLLLTWLTASADRGLVMRPAEIHFIAGGPFRDRDVITLNLVRLAFRALISAAVLSLLASAYVASYLSALVGMWLLISVSLLVGMIASLSARRSHVRLTKILRRLLTVSAILVGLTLIAQALQLVRAREQSPRVSNVAAAASETVVGSVILPPLAWMFRPISSPDFYPTTCRLLPSRLGVVLILVLAVYLLGGHYLEASTARTDQSVAKRQAALRSGVASGGGWMNGVSLPMFGRLGGVGCVAWMQMVHSLRILPRFLVFTAMIVGVVLVIPLMVDQQRLSGVGTIGWMAGLTAYADFLLLLQLPVGFLGPVAQREMLKSLPIAAWRIVLGQLAGPIIPVASLHLLVMLLFLYLVPDNRWLVLQTNLALIPAAIVVIANINLLGSWNIIRPRALQQRDALAAGRAMASVWIFFAMLTPAVLVATGLAAVSGWLLGGSPTSYMGGAAVGGLLSSSIYILLLARSFNAWQPTPAEVGAEETEYDR